MPKFRNLNLSGIEFKFIDESKIPLPEQAPNGEYDQILRTNGDGTTRWDNVDATPTANSTNPVQSGGVKTALDGKKNTQSAVSDPAASGNALAFIDTISQNEQGVITVTKKSVTVDDTPTANSTNPVQSGGVKTALDGKKNTQSAVSDPAASGNALAFIDTISQNEQGVITVTKKSVTVDDTPTANSTNPVQSGGVKTALDGKKNTQSAVSDPAASGNALAFIDTISQNEQGVITVTKKSVTVDDTPTANSTNPVQSGGVKTALDGKKNTQSAVSDPAASGNALAFIDTISQNEQGVITVTKKSVQVNNFLGNGTHYTYPSKWSGSANDITYEYHGFVYNVSNVPGEQYGFLDVSYANGSEFSPTNAKPIIRQVWTNYNNPRDIRIRLKAGDSAWTSWVRCGSAITANIGTITGTGSTVTVTKTVTGVTDNMIAAWIQWGTPVAVKGDVTVTTAANSVTISAVVNGSTTVKVGLTDAVEVAGI